MNECDLLVDVRGCLPVNKLGGSCTLFLPGAPGGCWPLVNSPFTWSAHFTLKFK